MMRYPVAIERPAEPGRFHIVVPDLPGCSATGDSIASAMANAEEAIILQLRVLIGDGLGIPAPSDMDDLQDNPTFTGWKFGLIPVDVALLAPAGGRQ